MIWRLASAQLIAARIAPRYAWPSGGVDRRAGQLAVGQLDAVTGAATAMRFKNSVPI